MKKIISIRPMEKEDFDEILRIEETCFHTPWSRKSFEIELKKDISISLVADWDRVVAGYTIGWHIVDEIHIANLAVHPDYRNRGIGEHLIRNLLTHAEELSLAGLEVRRSNQAARMLYKKLGFEEIGIRANYYVKEREDAILMVKQLRLNP
jgi:ribosomal-protein-alanine N-acetyltransferase